MRSPRVSWCPRRSRPPHWSSRSGDASTSKRARVGASHSMPVTPFRFVCSRRYVAADSPSRPPTSSSSSTSVSPALVRDAGIRRCGGAKRSRGASRLSARVRGTRASRTRTRCSRHHPHEHSGWAPPDDSRARRCERPRSPPRPLGPRPARRLGGACFEHPATPRREVGRGPGVARPVRRGDGSAALEVLATYGRDPRRSVRRKRRSRSRAAGTGPAHRPDQLGSRMAAGVASRASERSAGARSAATSGVPYSERQIPSRRSANVRHPRMSVASSLRRCARRASTTRQAEHSGEGSRTASKSSTARLTGAV